MYVRTFSCTYQLGQTSSEFFQEQSFLFAFFDNVQGCLYNVVCVLISDHENHDTACSASGAVNDSLQGGNYIEESR